MPAGARNVPRVFFCLLISQLGFGLFRPGLGEEAQNAVASLQDADEIVNNE